MTLSITMTPTERLEIGVGRVAPEGKSWIYGEYFPSVGPVMAEWGFRNLAAFDIVATNLEGISPVEGSFCRWPDSASRHGFQNDPRFLAVKDQRDAVLEMSDGHLFLPPERPISVDGDGDYALIIARSASPDAEAILDLPLADDTHSQEFAGKTLALRPWSDASELLLKGPASEAAVLRIRFR